MTLKRVALGMVLFGMSTLLATSTAWAEKDCDNPMTITDYYWGILPSIVHAEEGFDSPEEEPVHSWADQSNGHSSAASGHGWNHLDGDEQAHRSCSYH